MDAMPDSVSSVQSDIFTDLSGSRVFLCKRDMSQPDVEKFSCSSCQLGTLAFGPGLTVPQNIKPIKCNGIILSPL